MKITKEMRERKKLIKRLGLRINGITQKGKHPKIEVTDGCKIIFMTCPASGSDRRGDKNMVAFLKREFLLTA